jgi:formate-dependent phosphoribosylglycinamide formyltransferase (GAR transformylase)
MKNIKNENTIEVQAIRKEFVIAAQRIGQTVIDSYENAPAMRP